MILRVRQPSERKFEGTDFIGEADLGVSSLRGGHAFAIFAKIPGALGCRSIELVEGVSDKLRQVRLTVFVHPLFEGNLLVCDFRLGAQTRELLVCQPENSSPIDDVDEGHYFKRPSV